MPSADEMLKNATEHQPQPPGWMTHMWQYDTEHARRGLMLGSSVSRDRFCVIESSSPDWLGRFSNKPSIKEMGLWNVRDGSEYDFKFFPYSESFLSHASAVL
jgi:hypothetical protein